MELKRSKDPVKYAKKVLWFLTSVSERLERSGWSRVSTYDNVAVIVTKEYDYDFNCLNLVAKRLSDDVWECKMTKFERKKSDYVTNRDTFFNYFTFWIKKRH